MKKIISICILAALVFQIFPTAYAYNDVAKTEDYYLACVRLRDLGILSGYEDNTFRADNSITRAEFTKIVVCMMNKEDEARNITSVSGFFDVGADFWAAPYINYAVSKDILSGYSDGSFGPNRTISFQEAVTILLRTLGYTEKEVGYFWPNNYVNAAARLGISEGMDFSSDSQITRKTAALLTDRAMFAKPAASSLDTYLQTAEYTVLSDALILDKDKKSDNISVLAGNLKINNASTYIAKTNMEVTTGDMYEYAVIDKDGYLVAVKEYGNNKGLYQETGTVNRVSGNSVEYTMMNGVKNSYRADDSFITYYDNTKMTFASAKSKITAGTDITFYGNNYGLWNIAVIGNSNDIDPVLSGSDCSVSTDTIGGIPINKENLIVYRGGEAATLGDIKANDVVYYNTKTNTMDVYTKKVTGNYYAAYPSKAYVESVSVNGKTYEIGYKAATAKLDASVGAFEIGDKVTLLLGKNDEVVFVTDNVKGFDYSTYGVLLEVGQRVATEGKNEGNSEFTAKIFMTDGEVYELITDSLYKNSIGKLVRISYGQKGASLTNVATKNATAYCGEINQIKRTINGKYFLKDAVIIQRDSDENASVAECKLIDFDTLSAKEIDEGHIINVVSSNSFGDIAVMYVKDLENNYNYGVITGFEKTANEIVGYKIFSDGLSKSYVLNGILSGTSLGVGKGVGFKEGALGTKVISLAELDSSNSIDAIENGRIMLDGKIFEMADDVEVVDITMLGAYKTLTLDELEGRGRDITGVTIYSDKSLSRGGIVRVITVNLKN